ncbi:MAG: flagellar hook capping FlgD N-terminal domain-containing protein [Mariprofundales bacterium]|nr:flagellar hook capping FlgD N-terminal domain-containing protein [Mariprofundales bacterium]
MLKPTLLHPSVSNAASTAANRNTDLGQKDIFLKLLVAQMKFQNPLKPQDPTKMSSQLAQFNTLEATLKTNTLLQKLVTAQTAGQSATASSPASYLGKTAIVPLDHLNYTGGTQAFDVGVSKGVKQGLAVISDSNGIPVRSINLGSLTAGNHTITWDGLNDQGVQAAPANYQLKVVAADALGTPVDAQAQRSGKVTSVKFTPGGSTQLIIGGVAVDMSKISQISL